MAKSKKKKKRRKVPKKKSKKFEPRFPFVNNLLFGGPLFKRAKMRLKRGIV
ncbi:MAG: hypothetical protein ACW968_01315 [Candidatus Thorarchaeota archaeon]|jgi:hypothetical protein